MSCLSNCCGRRKNSDINLFDLLPEDEKEEEYDETKAARNEDDDDEDDKRRPGTRDSILRSVQTVRGYVLFVFTDCQKSETFYFWLVLLKGLEDFFGKITDSQFQEQINSNPELVAGFDNFEDSLQYASIGWKKAKRQRMGNSTDTGDYSVDEAEARLHCSFAQLFDALKQRTKRPWRIKHWQFSAKSSTPRPARDTLDKQTREGFNSAPLVGRLQDVCFWPRFFGTDKEVPIARFCEGLLLHLQLVEKQTIPLSLETFQALVQLTLRNPKVTLIAFTNFMQLYGPTLDKVFDRICGAATIRDGKIELPFWVSHAGEIAIKEMIGMRKGGAPDPDAPHDENEAQQEELIHFMMRVSKEGNSFVLHYQEERDDEDEGQEDESKAKSKSKMAYVPLTTGYVFLSNGPYQTTRQFLLDYVCPKLGCLKERQALLQEQLAWRAVRETWKENQTNFLWNLGKFFSFRIHSFFEWTLSMEEFERALDDLVECKQEVPQKKIWGNRFPVLQGLLQDINKHFPNFGLNDYYADAHCDPKTVHALDDVIAATTKYFDLDGLTDAPDGLRVLFSCRDFRVFWFAVWEVDLSPEVYHHLLELTEVIADRLRMCIDQRPDMSSFWLRVASFGIYNRCKSPAGRAMCTEIGMLTLAIRTFGKWLHGDSSALCLSSEFPILGLFLHLLDIPGKDIGTWNNLEHLATAAQGIRNMMDFLSVNEDTNFASDQESRDDKFLNQKFSTPMMRQRGVMLLLEYPFLPKLCRTVAKRWKFKIARWIKAQRRKKHASDELPANFADLDRGGDFKHLVTLSLELVAMLRICVYSRYRSQLILENQRWVVKYLHEMLSLRAFETPFVTANKLCDADEKLRSVFNLHYSLADYFIRINVNWSRVQSDFDALQKRTMELAGDYLQRIVGAEVVGDDAQINLYHCQLACVPSSLYRNTNVEAMKAGFSFTLEPEEGGRARQKRLITGIADIAEMFIHQSQLSEKPWIRIIADYDLLWYRLTLVLVIIVNGIMVPTVTFSNGAAHVEDRAHQAIKAMGALHTFFALLMTVAHFLDNYKFEYRRQRKRRDEWLFRASEKGRQKSDTTIDADGIDPRAEEVPLASKLPWHDRDVMLYLKSAFTWDFTWHIGYLTLSILGLRWSVLWAYSLVLAVFSTDLAQTLLRALRAAWRGLLVAYAMGLAIVYGFATFSFWMPWMNGTYDFYYAPLQWGVFMGQLMAHFDQGLLGPPSWNSDGDQTGREPMSIFMFLWSFIYNIIIINILIAIISGVVVDAFGQIRDRRTAQKEASLKNCLICNAAREDLDEKFEHHIAIRHPLRNYIYLTIYALRKKSQEKHATAAHKLETKPFDNLPLLKNIDTQICRSTGEFLPSWQLHQKQLSTYLLDLGLGAESASIKEEVDNPYYWNLAIPLKSHHARVLRTRQVGQTTIAPGSKWTWAQIVQALVGLGMSTAE